MALQLGLRRGLLASNGVNSSLARSTISKSSFGGISQLRMKSTDAGDVIGIDLGTTNSCVAIMVRLKTVYNVTCLFGWAILQCCALA